MSFEPKDPGNVVTKVYRYQKGARACLGGVFLDAILFEDWLKGRGVFHIAINEERTGWMRGRWRVLAAARNLSDATAALDAILEQETRRP